MFRIPVAFVLAILLGCSGGASAYSVLTHEEIVDLLWTDTLRPLLLSRYPDLSEDQIKEAHAYAYGGAVIQDLGYYPFGAVAFSNLVHYVRSGDFVRELILESQNADEFAFALGARDTRPSIRPSRSNIQSCERNSVIPLRSRTTGPRI